MKKSQIFFYFCLSFIIGVAIGSYFFIPFFRAYAIFLSGLIFLILGWNSVNIRIFGFCLLIIFLGIWRFQISIPQIDNHKIEFYRLPASSAGLIGEAKKEKIVFRGTISEELDVRKDHVKLTVKSRQVLIDDFWQKVSGKVLVRTDLYPRYQYGDELEIKCLLEKPPKFEDFAYDEYLARYHIYSTCFYPKITLISSGHGSKFFHGVLKFKERVKLVIEQSLPDPEASFLTALTTGVSRGLPDDLSQKFSLVGLSHIIAVSGSHIVIIFGILGILTVNFYLSRRKAFYFNVAFLILFIVLTGMSASAVRAGLMGFLILWARQIGRLNRSVNAVFFTAVLMLLFNPMILKNDLGFQLSFLAVLGLIYVYPLIENYFRKIPNYRYFEIRSYLAMTFAAQIVTFPLIAYRFHYFSVLAPIANILVIPVLPALMFLAFLAEGIGLVCLLLAKILFFPVWLLLKYIVLVVEILSRAPFAAIPIEKISGGIVAVIYLLIFFWVISAHRHKIKNMKTEKNENI